MSHHAPTPPAPLSAPELPPSPQEGTPARLPSGLRHLALIMDGNGRWAEARGLERAEGHARGVEVVREVVRHARALRLQHLTLFAFSSLNWGRPTAEVAGLMRLLHDFLESELPEMVSRGIRLKGIGERAMLPPWVRAKLEEVEERTARGREMTLSLALSYDGRRDLVSAARRLVDLARRGLLLPADVGEETLMGALSTAESPEVDLVIRTSGERRLSGFLPLEACYAELVFLERAWPEFTTADLDAALAEFDRRQRRFGLTGAQVGAAGAHAEVGFSPA